MTIDSLEKPFFFYAVRGSNIIPSPDAMIDTAKMKRVFDVARNLNDLRFKNALKVKPADKIEAFLNQQIYLYIQSGGDKNKWIEHTKSIKPIFENDDQEYAYNIWMDQYNTVIVTVDLKGNGHDVWLGTETKRKELTEKLAAHSFIIGSSDTIFAGTPVKWNESARLLVLLIDLLKPKYISNSIPLQKITDENFIDKNGKPFRNMRQIKYGIGDNKKQPKGLQKINEIINTL